MINRIAKKHIEKALKRQAAAVLIGPRQSGKTTLSFQLSKSIKTIYLDLETAADRAKLDEPALYFEQHKDCLIILDEIHRKPELFQELRGIIDQSRREGIRTGRFLILGSAAIDLLRQSSESLAGRIEYVQLTPLNTLEIESTNHALNQLWLRGGFPDSYLAHSDEDSFVYRLNLIRTYLERDVPMFGPRIPAETLNRLWTMLAHNQGAMLNASRLASGLGVSSPTVSNYIDLLSDLLLVRRLQPYHINIGKRLVKRPKTYIRDSGLLHALLGIETLEDLLGHPVAGPSWEGHIIENILSAASSHVKAWFYRSSGGAEADLLLDLGKSNGLWAIEIKRSLSPQVDKGLSHVIDDVKPDKVFIAYPGRERLRKSHTIEAIHYAELIHEIHACS